MRWRPRYIREEAKILGTLCEIVSGRSGRRRKVEPCSTASLSSPGLTGRSS